MAISRLLGALRVHEVAYRLRSKTGNSDMATELSKLFGLVRSGCFNFEHYRALSRLVVKQASDIDIWNAVLDRGPWASLQMQWITSRQDWNTIWVD